jgi:hypothetical protein
MHPAYDFIALLLNQIPRNTISTWQQLILWCRVFLEKFTLSEQKNLDFVESEL